MESISKAIAAAGIAAVLLGIAMAYMERHGNDLNLAFIPLIVGFAAIFVFFYLIEKRGNDKYGKIKE
jgi:predicted PurR-regulated permease PerM